MVKYIFGDAKLDIRGIDPERVAAKVRELSIHKGHAVRVVEISRAMHVEEPTVSAMLAQGELLGLVRRVDDFRWLPGQFAPDLTT